MAFTRVKTVLERLMEYYPDLLFWLGLPCLGLIVFLATGGTTWHQFGIGLLAAAVSVVVIMGIFEFVYQIIMAALSRGSSEGSSPNKSSSRGL